MFHDPHPMVATEAAAYEVGGPLLTDLEPLVPSGARLWLLIVQWEPQGDGYTYLLATWADPSCRRQPVTLYRVYLLTGTAPGRGWAVHPQSRQGLPLVAQGAVDEALRDVGGIPIEQAICA